MHDSDWLAKAFTLSLIGYTSTWKNSYTPFWLAVKAFFTCENIAYRFLALRNEILVLRVIKALIYYTMPKTIIKDNSTDFFLNINVNNVKIPRFLHS